MKRKRIRPSARGEPETHWQKALREGIDRAGGQVRLAQTLGLKSQGSISNWLLRDKRVPAERVLEVERATGVSRHDLRPDLYPRESPVQQYAASA